ncbi:putative amidohydrolase YtcJ [Paraliobacillus quinghaiensis]|uniref:Amidohydrolase YtcJ n=1 Tax=Paraliobacillus quinghaiensis TaxID=470815 RepID=A0A917TKF9_9BACI|nr:amidohydrolase [Paraliobacillus quinghaiensis]GGM26508.1 putative amidohydrolase YtcJ [Paraliobacillus quinghaiensis]
MGTLWFGGTIYTMKEENEKVEAIYTENGIIVATGNLNELKEKYNERIVTNHDLQGTVLFPGFVDSHLHIIGHGEKIVHLDLSKMMHADEVLYALERRLETLSEGEWLIGEGWNENQWDDPRVIDKSELDEITEKHPVMLTRVCRHAIIANSKAIQLANITEETLDPQGGKIVRDENGALTGYFLDNAQDLIKQAIPDVSKNDLTKLVTTSVDDLLRLGLVGGHSEDLAYYGENSFNKTWEAFHKAIEGKNRKFRAHLLVHHEVIEDMEKRGLGYGSGTNYVTLGAMKIFSDGALGGRTAWLQAPYSDDPGNVGIPIHTEENLESLVIRARQLEMPIAVHAIGDQAILTVANLLYKYPLKNERRDRIIHAQIVDEAVLQALKKTNAVLDIQPSFVASDFPWVIERIGKERVKTSYPWKTFLQEDIPCAAGSDAPIEEVNPLLGIEAFVLRKSSLNGKIYNEKEQLSVFEAVSLYTEGSAYVIGHEHDRGLIEPGYVADFTIFDQDLFKVKKESIRDVNVVMTVVDESIMFEQSNRK